MGSVSQVAFDWIQRLRHSSLPMFLSFGLRSALFFDDWIWHQTALRLFSSLQQRTISQLFSAQKNRSWTGSGWIFWMGRFLL